MSTSIATTAELGATLTEILLERGLQVDQVSAPGARAALPGPLLVIRLPMRADARAEVAVVVVDGKDDSGEHVVQALAQSLAAALGDLVSGDAAIEAAPNLDPVLASFTAPADAGLIMRSGSPVGAVLWSVDRRRPRVEPAVAPPVPAGSEAALTSVPAGAAIGGNLGGGATGGARSGGEAPSMHLLRDVHLDVSVELGRTVMTVAEVLELSVGSVVELDRAARAPVDIRVNGMLLAKGEVVVIDDEYAVRVTDIIDPTAGTAD